MLYIVTVHLLETLRISQALIRYTWMSPRPFMLYLKPTARCDSRCRICKRWQEPTNASEEMSTEEIFQVLSLFRRMGAVVLTIWGGEPLLRSDLGKILQKAKELGFRTAMCTNARSLSRQADGVLPWLDTLLCSLDGFGKNHDRMRGVEGLFDHVVEGIRAASAYDHLRTKIWATVHSSNVGDLESIAQLARDLGVWVEYFPIGSIPGYNNDMVLDDQALYQAFDRVIALQRAGYPVWNPHRALRKMRDNSPIRCNFGRIALQVDHRGLVHSCEDPDGSPMFPWGRYDEIDWETFFQSEAFAKAREELMSCNKCRLPCVMEMGDGLSSAYFGMFWQSVTRPK